MMSRRLALCLLCSGLVCALFSACGGSRAKQVEGSILDVNVGAEVEDLDPQILTGIPEHRVTSALFEGLADLDPKTLKPVPAVAKSWDISDDAKVYTFHLRDDARWSNGDPVTAEDFAYSWQRVLSPGLAAEYAYLLHHIKNARPYNEGDLDDFSQVGVKVLDTLTLEVTLESPTPYFLQLQFHQAYYPVHRATIESFGAMDQRNTKWTRAGNHVGNGPFRLTEWRPSEYIAVEKNPYYWDAASVRLDGIRFYPIDQLQTEERSFRNGELDMTETLPLNKVSYYKEKNPEEFVNGPYWATYYYRFNTTKPPFDDVRVRRAFALAVTRETLTLDLLQAGEQPAGNLVPPNPEGYTFSGAVGTDVEQARALLAEAGYPNGEGFPRAEVLYNTSENHKLIAEALQRMWTKNLGVNVTLSNQDWKVYLDSTSNLNYQIARAGWIGDVLDPVNFLECFLGGNGNNRTGWKNAEYDRLIREAYEATDETARNGLYQQAETVLMDEMPIMPLYFYTLKFLKAPEVKGYTPNLLDYRRWKDMWIEVGGAS